MDPAACGKLKKVSEKSSVNWIAAVILGWIVPGGGHMLLKRGGRGVLVLASVSILFLVGLMMRGALFTPQRESFGSSCGRARRACISTR